MRQMIKYQFFLANRDEAYLPDILNVGIIVLIKAVISNHEQVAVYRNHIVGIDMLGKRAIILLSMLSLSATL
jgi:hypothetical protein